MTERHKMVADCLCMTERPKSLSRAKPSSHRWCTPVSSALCLSAFSMLLWRWRPQVQAVPIPHQNPDRSTAFHTWTMFWKSRCYFPGCNYKKNSACIEKAAVMYTKRNRTYIETVHVYTKEQSCIMHLGFIQHNPGTFQQHIEQFVKNTWPVFLSYFICTKSTTNTAWLIISSDET